MTILKDIDLKLPVALCVNCAVFAMLAWLNDSLAFASVYVFALGLLVVPPALFLGFWGMTACLVVSGFFVEVAMPVHPGLMPAIMALSGAGVFLVREKFRNLEPVGIFSLCWIVNAALFGLSCLFVFPVGVDGFGLYAMRIATDFVCSSLAVFLLSNFVLRVYRSVFFLAGLNLEIPEDA